MKARIMNWVAYVTYMEEERNAYRHAVGNHAGRRCAEDQVIGGRVVLKWMLKKWDERV